MHRFTYENDYEDDLQTTVEFTVPSDADLEDMCDVFGNFLRAVGYEFDGHIEISSDAKKDWFKPYNVVVNLKDD